MAKILKNILLYTALVVVYGITSSAFAKEVRVFNVAGKEFHVPKAYAPRTDREESGIWIHMAFLPDLSNTEEDKNLPKEDIGKNRVTISIKHDKSAADNAHFPTRAHGTFTRAKERFTSMESEPSYGETKKFKATIGPHIKQYIYVLFDDGGIAQNSISCTEKNDSQRFGLCRSAIWPIDENIIVYYTFKDPYIEDWKNINEQVKELVLSFYKSKKSGNQEEE